MLTTLPMIADLDIRGTSDLQTISPRQVRREALDSFGRYAVAASPPLNTANSVLAYSSDNSNFTDLVNIVNVEPNGRMRKVIERRLKGQTRVQKFVARLDDGELKVTSEYGSALFNTFETFFAAKTRIYMRDTMDDTGGTNGSKMLYDGYIKELTPPATPGDDADEIFSFTLAVNVMTFTTGL